MQRFSLQIMSFFYRLNLFFLYKNSILLIKRIAQHVKNQFFNEYTQWSLWIPIVFGSGICCYIAWPCEPTWQAVWWSVFISYAFCVVVTPIAYRWITLIICCTFYAGFMRIMWTCHSLPPMLKDTTPFIQWTGNIRHVDHIHDADGQTRLRFIIDNVTPLKRQKIHHFPYKKISIRLRVRKPIAPASFHGSPVYVPGQRVIFRAYLRPFPEGWQPGNYPMRRHMFFLNIQAQGFSFYAPHAVNQFDRSTTQPLFNFPVRIPELRHHCTHHILNAFPRLTAALIAGLTTGEKNMLSQEERMMFSRSGLSHMLAISGLHMAIIAGILWVLWHRILSFCLPLRFKSMEDYKLSGILAGIGVLAYLCISGAAISAQRAAVMMLFMLIAMFYDRQIVSMRNITFTGMMLLIASPGSILMPGFQLSFLAVTTLIFMQTLPLSVFCVHSNFSRIAIIFNTFIRITTASLMTSVITAPFVGQIFHQVSLIGIISNVVAIPILTWVLMPSILIWILFLILHIPYDVTPILHFLFNSFYNLVVFFANLPFSSIHFSPISAFSLATMLIGFIWLTLWKTAWRMMGIVFIAIGIFHVLWFPMPQPTVWKEKNFVAVHHASTHTIFMSKKPSKWRYRNFYSWIDSLGYQNENFIILQARTQHSALHYDHGVFTLTLPYKNTQRIVHICKNLTHRQRFIPKTTDLTLYLTNQCAQHHKTSSVFDDTFRNTHALIYANDDKYWKIIHRSSQQHRPWQ